MATLYDLSANYKRLVDAADQFDEEVFQDTLNSIDDALEQKADGYAIIDQKLKADEKMFDDEIKRLQERKKAIINNRKRLKESLYDSMKLTGKEKFKTDKFSFYIQKHPPKLVVDDEKEIPKAYWEEQEPKLNKRLLLEDLKADDYPNFKGAHIEAGEGVRFR